MTTEAHAQSAQYKNATTFLQQYTVSQKRPTFDLL